MRQIELRRTPRGWMASMLVDGQPDAEVIATMGTHIVPTAYTSRASQDEVVLGISELNRDAAIWVVR